MQELNGAQRKYLRGLAHGFKPLVHIGKNGITDEVITSIDEALSSNELIKIKFLDFKSMKAELTDEITKKTDASTAGIIGNIAIIYRQHKNPEKRKISLP